MGLLGEETGGIEGVEKQKKEQVLKGQKCQKEAKGRTDRKGRLKGIKKGVVF